MPPQNFQNPSPNNFNPAPQAPIPPTPPPQAPEPGQGSPLVWLIGLAAALIIAIVVGYLFVSRNTGVIVPPASPLTSQGGPASPDIPRGESSVTLPPENTQTPALSNVPADWQTYRNEEYGFEFMYPSEWTWGLAIEESTEVSEKIPKFGSGDFNLALFQDESGKMLGDPGGIRVFLTVEDGQIIISTLERALVDAKQEYQEDITNQEKGEFPSVFWYEEPEVVEINGVKAIRKDFFRNEHIPEISYTFPERGLVFSLSREFSSGSGFSLDDHQILISTFKFINN